jgi:autotransporter-associated beta strand protein
MKNHSLTTLVAVLLLASVPSSVPAAVEFWDPNGATPGTSVSGNWDLVTSNWSATIDSGTSNTWTQGDDAVFGLAAAYTVTLTAPISVGNLTATGTAGGLTIVGDAVNNLTLGSASTFNITNSSRTLTVSAPMVGTGALTKTGNGTLTLSGANTYSGGTFISSGSGFIGIAVDTVSSGGVISSSALGTGTITVNTAGHNVFASGAARILENPVILNAGLTTSGSQNLTFRNGVWQLVGGGRTITVSNTAITRIESNLTDDGVARTLTKAGPGTLVLAGTNNTFLGGLTINASSGAVRIDNDNGLQLGSVVTVNTGSTLDLNGFSGKVVGLAGGGVTALGSGTLTIANAGTSRNFTGMITGTGTLVISNSISQQLEGTNTFSGGLQIQAGTLFLRTNAAAGDPITKSAGTGTITMIGTDPVVANTTAAIGGNLTTGTVIITNRVVLTSGRVLLFPSNGGTVQFNSIFSGSGGIQRDNNGSGPVVLTGNNTFSGGLNIESRVLGLGHKNALGTGPFIIGNPITPPGNPITLVPTTDLSGANAITNVTTVNQNFFFFATNNFELSGPVTLSNAVIITSLGSSVVKISGNIAGPGGITKDGTNSLTLTGANTYEGSTTVSLGTLLVNNTSGSGTSTNSVTVAGGATLGGNGAVGGPVTVSLGGNVGAGSSAGNLTLLNGLDLSGGGTNTWELAAQKDSNTGTAGADFDQLSLTGGNLVLGGSSILLLQFIGSAPAPSFGTYFWQSNHTWKIISLSGTAANPVNSDFSSIAGTNGIVSGTFSTSVDGSGNVFLSYVAAPLPPRPVIDRTIAGAGTTSATLSWSAVNGVTYQVQYKHNLNDANWSVLGSVTATGSTASINDPTDPPAAQRFYRVIVL